MSDALDPAKAEAGLWRTLKDQKIGMLGVAGGKPRHMQPMTAYAEEGARELWFFTYRDTDLVKDVGSGHAAMFCLVTDDLYACLGGRLEEHFDRERMERYWNPVVAAWYPDGKDDPRLTLLRFQLDDAHVWLSKAGPVKFAWEIAKANATHDTPDLGGKAEVEFR